MTRVVITHDGAATALAAIEKRQAELATVPDDLDRPVTQRQLLEVLAEMANDGDMFAEWAWERFTARWRQEARAQALTHVDHGHEHPTREG